MRFAKSLSVLVTIAVLVGCASTPIQPRQLGDSFYAQKSQKVGIYVTYPDKVKMHLPGATCLLCLAAAAAANSDASAQMAKLSPDEFSKISEIIAEKITEKDMTPVVITDENFLKTLKRVKVKDTNYAKKDFRPVKRAHGVDAVIVIQIEALGAERTYSGYAPTGAPQGFVKGTAYAVNLDTNAYEMYQPLDQRVAVKGEWKEPPEFPGLTNAYYQAVEAVKDQVNILVQ